MGNIAEAIHDEMIREQEEAAKLEKVKYLHKQNRKVMGNVIGLSIGLAWGLAVYNGLTELKK